jgi:drug/metabolite transporter (DMT)-like permease
VSGKSRKIIPLDITGLLLSLVTALMWGTLPVALKKVLEVMDAVTVTWVRLVFAAILVGGFYLISGKWPPKKHFSRRSIALLGGVALALAANYWLFLAGLNLVAPPLAQVTIQLGPFFLALGGWLLFSENIRRRQMTGFFAMVTGFWVFYSAQVTASGSSGTSGFDQQTAGVWLVVLAAVAWAFYALIQKLLAVRFPSSFILFCGYAGASVLLLPVSRPSVLLELRDPAHWWLLLFCCLNTVIAYGCFAEAVRRWDASRVSAVLALTPILTFLSAGFVSGAITDWLSPALLGGIGLVVGGSMVAALGARRRDSGISSEV